MVESLAWSPQFMVRRAVVADAGAVYAFRRAVLGESEFLVMSEQDLWPPEQEHDLLAAYARDPAAVVLVAEADAARGHQVVGLVTVLPGPYQRNKHVGHVSLAVRRSWWRRGIGRELMRGSLAAAHGAGLLHKLSLQVHAGNAPACALYRGLGFAVEGRLQGEARLHGAPHDLLCMGLWLRRPGAKVS
jgi:ribosomal protein S18 acetylase RimI-like enzyme